MQTTSLTTKSGPSVLINDEPCTACGCYEVFKFVCNCGEIHNDCCYNCGSFSGMNHESVEEQANKLSLINQEFEQLVAKRCDVGMTEHIHDGW